MTYDEHVDCDRALREATKKIEQLQAELAKYKAGNVPVSQIIADNEAMTIENEQLQTDNDNLAKEAEGLRDELCYIASEYEFCSECSAATYAYDAVKEKNEPKKEDKYGKEES